MKNMVKELEMFLAELKKQRCLESKERYLKPYDKMIEMTEEFIGSNREMRDFRHLDRYVSDCLPWTEEILKPWNRLSKIMEKAEKA